MEERISLLTLLIPALPLAASVLTAVCGWRLRRHSHYLVVFAIAASFVCSMLLLREIRTAHAKQPSEHAFVQTTTLWTWAEIPAQYDSQARDAGVASVGETAPRDFRIDITLRADALTVVMLCMVTFVSMLVAIFSVGYMRGDPGYWRFFAYLSLFVFSMTMLVSVSNFVLLYVFWEAVGACSYLLIGFWYQKPEAAAAGKKAFLVNRIGDFGFALAIFLIWCTYGTLNFHDTLAGDSLGSLVPGVLGESRLSDPMAYFGGALGLAICLLLLTGACGKSAQFPLHIWLPDAMEGPTPVSALIHAATMVTAGVYMVARCTPLFMASPEAQLLVACVGAVTALLGALIAMTQFDLKRVLAYSTISQLGYMFVGLGAGTFGGITAGMFHLFTHAFFKALLFLGAGSVMHAMGNVMDMRRFGGIRKLMPITHLTFFVGCLALAGFPFLSGFWSKDAILAAVHDRQHELTHLLEQRSEKSGQRADQAEHVVEQVQHHPAVVSGLSDRQLARHSWIYHAIYLSGMLTALLTAFYTFRAFFMTFHGPFQVPSEAGSHAHESPAVMTWPLVTLAIGAVVAGIYFDRTWSMNPTHRFAEFLSHTPSLAEGAVATTKGQYGFHLGVAGASGTIALLGMLLATYLYLGTQHEIRWLKSLWDFEAFARWFDVESVSRWKDSPGAAAVRSAARRMHLGWLTSAFGELLLLLALVLTTPFQLGKIISPYKLSSQRFYLDEIYQLVIVWPLRSLATVCYALDRSLVDAFVDTVGRLPRWLGALMRSCQMGLLSFYGLAMVLGTVVLVVAKILWISQ